jgi:uncharacterized membrane protein YhaH (DUF805 family)
MAILDLPQTSSFSQLFNFKGRLNRKRYNKLLVVFFVLGCLLGVLGSIHPALDLLVVVPCYWLSWSLNAKRLHDMGHSGWMQCWWWMGVMAVGVVMIVPLLQTKPDELPAIVKAGMLILTSVGLHSIYFFAFRKGVAGPNAYGPDPLARQQ